MYKSWSVLICLLYMSSTANAQKVLSILYFDNTTADMEYQWLSKGLADMIISDLNGLPGIKIIERESLEKVLQEQALSLTGLTEEGSVAKIGKLLQADQLIYGAYILNDDLFISSQCYDNIRLPRIHCDFSMHFFYIFNITP